METAQVNRLMVEITRIGTLIDDISGLMSAQQKVLQMRGMQLPSGTIEQLLEVQQQISHIRDVLTEQQPELAQLRALVRTMSHISSKLDLNQVLNEVIDTFIELTGAERGFIVLMDPHTQEKDYRVRRNMDRDTINKDSFVISRTVIDDVAAKGEAVITTNAQEDPRYKAQESIISYAVRSIICVPLKVKNQIIGVAYSDHRYRKELFGEQELKFLMAFANQAAVAIENARLFESVQRQLVEISEIRNFLDNIFASIASGVITLNLEGIVLTANRAAEVILGISAPQSQGLPYTEVFPALYEGFEDLLTTVRLGSQKSVEINPVLPNRGAATLRLKLSPLRSGNQILGIAIVFDDLTALKERDETLRVVNTYLSEEMVSQIHNIDSLGLGGEEREISAVFADVRGFTTFSENLPPETLMSVINRYLSVSSEAVQLSEGIIDKFMGDAVLGLYNTQLNPQEDHAVRCVRAALMMVRDVEALHETLPPNQRLFYGIGIHTGHAIIGNVGSPSRKEFTAIGDAIVYAKKFQETAQGGEVIISEKTYQQVQHVFNCEVTERPLRGENVARRLYKVIGVHR